MAYVAITSNLRRDVRDRIRTLGNAEINAMPDPGAIEGELSSLPEIIEAVTDHLWRMEPDLRERLSKYNRKGYAPVRINGATSEEPLLHLTVCVLQTPCFSDIPTASYNVDYANSVQLPHDFHPLVAKAREARAAKEEAQKRWSAVAQEVNRFLENCKSLNEAVKLWPDVRRYLPHDAIERLDKKSEKAKAADDKTNAALEALKSIDLDRINASTVLARMAGAQV